MGLRPTDRIVTVGSQHFRWAPPPCFRCTHLFRQDTPEIWVRTILRHRPHLIIGQLERIVVIAHELLRLGRTVRARDVFVFGWTLTDDTRAAIGEAFGCDPVDAYGATETVWVGMECRERNGIHVPHHRLIVQAARPGNPFQPVGEGEVGELVLADVAPRTMPFLRYRIGDLGAVVHDPCRCGRAGPRIVNLLGRIMDLLVATDGRPVPFGSLRLYRRQRFEILADFQVVQETPDRVRLLWVQGPQWTPEAMEEARADIRRAMGPVQIVDERLDSIRLDGKAKHRRTMRFFDLPESSPRS
jgi:phenylacetate-CoA ligase